VQDALNSIFAKNIDIFFTSGDNTVMLAMQQIAQILQKKKIPYFTNTYNDVDKGAFISLGADYYQVGLQTGIIAEKVLNGENPKSIPIYDFVPEKLNINMNLVKEYKIKIPEKVLALYKQNSGDSK
jgi:ABC-type uncharacterized transport system substrate-binding protein